MARDKNGWVKLHSSILDKNFSLVEYKIFTGLLLLANSLKHNSPGLVDLSLRAIASRLGVSVEAVRQARDKFLKDQRVEIIPLPGKTKPIMAIRIVNFQYYQSRENVPQNRQSNRECQLDRTKNVNPVVQKIPPNRQTVLPSRHSRIQNSPQRNKETKEYINNKRSKGNGERRRNPRPVPRANDYLQPDEY